MTIYWVAMGVAFVIAAIPFVLSYDLRRRNDRDVRDLNRRADDLRRRR